MKDHCIKAHTEIRQRSRPFLLAFVIQNMHKLVQTWISFSLTVYIVTNDNVIVLFKNLVCMVDFNLNLKFIVI